VWSSYLSQEGVVIRSRGDWIFDIACGDNSERRMNGSDAYVEMMSMHCGRSSG